MHCNLRPPDAVAVVIRFNYDAHTNIQVSQPIRYKTGTYSFLSYSVLTTDTLLYSVTLTFDLEHW